MSEVWYEKVSPDTKLMQGDLINDCPLIAWEGEIDLKGSYETESLRALTKAIRADVITMTQSCDLEYEKVSNVLLCPHVSLNEYRVLWEEQMRSSGQNPTSKAWKNHCDDICDGFVWNIAMLNSFNNDELSTEHRVVDFRDVFTVPRIFLESLLNQRARPRLRLLPPYREHLSQSFARFFMRVGLPIPVAKLW